MTENASNIINYTFFCTNINGRQKNFLAKGVRFLSTLNNNNSVFNCQKLDKIIANIKKTFYIRPYIHILIYAEVLISFLRNRVCLPKGSKGMIARP